MAYTLKNNTVEIQIDSPLENYNFSRFDWTGKIVSLTYKNIGIAGVEIVNDKEENKSGKGFYNEFGFKMPVGYSETKVGDWFHKIGVGLLKKEHDDFKIGRKYEIQPATFEVLNHKNSLIISCKSDSRNGYSYELKKEIKLTKNGFIISYYLKNTGEKTIITDEYNHNFLSINNQLISSDYLLKFPFDIKPERFEESVNPEKKAVIGQNEIGFNGTPNEAFFFSNLSGDENREASWEIWHTTTKIGIRESGDFKTNKVNLWGSKHVISPELYFDITVEPGKDLEWSRTYTLLETL